MARKKVVQKKPASDKLPALTPPGFTITGIQARPVVVPMRMPLHTASGAIDKAALVLIDIYTSEGITGRSYLFAIGANNLKPIIALVDAMGEMITGDPVAPYEVERKLRRKYALLGVHNIVLIAMSGIDMALWDAYAQWLSQPLVRVLGGQVKPVRAYNSNGLGIMAPPKLAKEAVKLVRAGFSAVKLRLGRERAADDVAALRAVKKAIGPDVTLMCDFNQGLTMNEAIRRGRMLDEEGGLTWIEEPIRADNFEGTARIADALDTPVQIGENFMGAEQMAQALTYQCCDFVMPDVQRIGGVTGWMRAAALADAAGLDMSTHLFPEISSHLIAVTPTQHWLEYVDWAEPILAEPVQVKNSHVIIADRPGTGVAWDENAVRKYSV